jgi:hypothetical protein
MNLVVNARSCLFASIWLLALLSPLRAAPAVTAEAALVSPVGAFLADHLAYDFRVLSFGVFQRPADSTQNPSNGFLQIPRYVGDLEVRPDLRLAFDGFEASARPRARLDYTVWRDGARDGDAEWDSDFFLNEWMVRAKVRENLFVSYGRENLQWGPSFLFSPSNPFFQDNGRRNTFVEVPGMDFARFVWIPAQSWSFSFIANIDEGLNTRTGPGAFLSGTPPPPFERTYTVKADYTGRDTYASLILSTRGNGENIVGFFGGRTMSDAILLYGEGSLQQATRAFYPVENTSSPFGVSMEQAHRHESTLYPVILLGTSYTFESKGVLTVEYAYYGPGYGARDAATYYNLRRRAAATIGLAGQISNLGRQALGTEADTGLRLLRRNYALAQYMQTNIGNKLGLTFRWAQNLDDGSGQLTALGTYSLGKHTELFSVATVMAGGRNTEFGSVLDYQWILGLQYTF